MALVEGESLETTLADAEEERLRTRREQVAERLPYDDAVAINRYMQQAPNPAELPKLLDQVAIPEGINPAQQGSVRRSRSADPDERYKQDFLFQAEDAFAAAAGAVPIEFLMDNVEDIHLLGSDYSQVTEYVYNVSTINKAMEEADQLVVQARDSQVDMVMHNYQVSREEASTLLNKYDVALQQGTQAAEAASVEEMLATLSGVDQTAALERLKRGLFDPEKNEQDAAWLAAGRENIRDVAVAEFAKDVLPEGKGGRDFHNIMMGRDYTPGGVAMKAIGGVFGVVGGAIEGAAQGVGWLLEAGGLEVDGADFQRGFDLVFGDSDTAARRQAEEQWWNQEAGRTTLENVARFEAPILIDVWEGFKQSSPDEYAEYVAMAGGNENLARAMFGEEAQYMGLMVDGEETTIRDMVTKQAELYEDQVAYQLEQLEDVNFTMGDALLDIVSIWGEGVEIGATAATLGFKALGSGDLWDTSLTPEDIWTEIKEAGSPSGALGLEGTFTGLAFDLGSMAMLDPMTWVFGPRLAKTGRAGPVSVKQALQAVDSRMAGMVRQQIIDVVRSSNRGATATAAIMNSLGETGLGARYLAAVKGFKNPLTGFWEPMKKWGKVSDDVNIHTLGDLLPEGQLDDAARQAAEARLKNGTYDPVVVEYNPKTGATQIVSGAEEVAAGLLMDVGNIRATMRPNSKLGISQKLAGFTDDEFALIQKVADEGIEATVKGADETTRAQVIAQAGLLKGGAVKRGTIALKDGTELTVKSKGSFYMVVDDADNVVAGANILDEGAAIGVLPALEGQGVVGRLFDIAIQEGDTGLIMGAIKDVSLSADAARFAQGYAKRLVAKADDVLDETMKIRDWANQKGNGRLLDVDDSKYVAPRHLMPDEARWGDVIDMDELKRIEAQHILRGGDPMHAQRTAMSISIGHGFRDALQKSGVGQALERWFTPVNNNLNLRHTGPSAMANTNQVLNRIFGSVDDMERLEVVNNQLMNYWSGHGQLLRQSDDLTARARALKTQMDGFRNTIGGSEFGGMLDDVADEALKKATPEIRNKIRALQKEMDGIAAQQKALAGKLGDHSQLNGILADVFDDFNRTHIASKKAWKDLVDPETGLVPWEEIARRGTPVEKAVRAAKADEAKKLAQADKVHQLSSPGAGFAMPVSPLEMMAAAQLSQPAMRQLAHVQWLSKLREGLHTAHTAWMVDKVMTPRTAMVVSLDELMRSFHTGGTQNAWRYLKDKGIATAEGVRTITKLDEFADLPVAWQKRIQALESVPEYVRQLEQSIVSERGFGLDVIEFKKGPARNNMEYYQAAQQKAQGTIKEPGWQNYFKGKQAFKEWFETSTEAAQLREMDYFSLAENKRVARPSWDVVYEGYSTLFEKVYTSAIPARKQAAARAIWADAASQAGAKPVALPKWVLEGFGAVDGAAKMPAKSPIGWAVNRLSDAFYQKPMNYRQGFLAEWVRESEMARLTKLYDSQGVRIVSDADLLNLMKNKYPGLADDYLRQGLDAVSERMMQQEGVISQRFVDNLVESKVVAEMENQLYAAHMQSAAGRKARAVFPFGKPWADMWGFWGREGLSRPALRGWLNNENLTGLHKIAQNMVNELPFNPKTAGFVSRIAATDFDLDRIEEDPLLGGVARKFGIDRMDVGNALFLPHGGESPFMVLLPGFGFLPGAAIEGVLRNIAPDPAKEPQAYQLFVDQWSQILPGFGYTRPQGITQTAAEAVLGGGVVSRGISFIDSLELFTNTKEGELSNALTSDWKTGVAYDRQVKVAFSDPAIWEELADLTNATAGVGIDALIDEKLKDLQTEAAQRIGGQMLVEQGIELMLPGNVTTLSQNEELDDVWIKGLDYLGLSQQFMDRLDLSSEDGRRDSAQRIRSHFFSLDGDIRDNLVAAHPELAVNLVSMWQWDGDRASIDGVEGADLPYRSGGSTKDRARHQYLIETGYIKPVTPRQLAVRIIGTVTDAKMSTARRVFEEAAGAVNDQRWEHTVSEEWRGWFDQVLTSKTLAGQIPYRTPRDLWENFDKVRDIIWDLQGQPLNKDGTPNKYVLPQKMSPWGETLPSEFVGLRSEYEEGYPLPYIPNELSEAAAAIGLEIFSGQEMGEVYQSVADYRAEHLFNNPAAVATGGEFRAYLSPRSAERQSAETILNQALDHQGVSEETRFNYRKTFLFLDDAVQRKSDGDSSWLEVRDQAAQLFKGLRSDDIMGKLDLPDLWDQMYGRTLGALDWTPDEPSPLFGPEGGLNKEAQQILVRKVYDGDTLQFSTSPKERMFGPLGGPAMPPTVHSVRLLGVNAAEMGEEMGQADKDMLQDRIEEAIDNNIPIYIVKDPERYGYTDFYGRVFGWLYIGDEPFSRPDTQLPRR